MLMPDEVILADQLDQQKDNGRSKDEWTTIWETQSTPRWHLAETNKGLIQHFDRLLNGRKAITVFVPLCGKTVDMLWLYEHGHRIVGVELSKMAVEEFFSSNSIAFKETVQQEATVLKSDDGRIQIFVCDLLEFTREHLSHCEIEAVWDRGSFVAMSPCNRPRYVEVMAALMPHGTHSLFERIDYSDGQPGPPFCFTTAELQRLCEQYFELEYLSERPDERHNDWMLKYVLLTRK